MTQQSLTFESSMNRLEQIVRSLEKGDLPLDVSLELFQEGTQLVRDCGKLLDDAQMQVNKVLAGVDGGPVEEAFKDESDI